LQVYESISVIFIGTQSLKMVLAKRKEWLYWCISHCLITGNCKTVGVCQKFLLSLNLFQNFSHWCCFPKGYRNLL